jgi:HlyD family secretion protein
MSRSRLVAVAAALVAVAAVVVAGRDRDQQAQDGYVTAEVDRGSIVAAVTATGTVRPVTTVKVGTYVSGPIQAIDVDFNSRVTKGQRVAKIDPAPFEVRLRKSEANLETARARLTKSRADLALKKREHERMIALSVKQIVSASEVDLARSQYEQAAAQIGVEEAGLLQAEAERDEARINLAYTDIVSPVHGVVVSRSVDVGQTVAASFQTPVLFEIAEDLKRMEVAASVSESDIGAVRDGQRASFTVDAYPERDFTGAVAQVRNAPVVVQNVVTYEVVISVDNHDLALKPGMTATVSITVAEVDDVVRLPVRALRFEPPGESHAPRTERSEPGVWLLVDDKLEHVRVETGARDDRFVEIRSQAPAPGDQVVLSLREQETTDRRPSLPGMIRFR